MSAVWVNGALQSSPQGQLSALDHGVTVGDGVFETCKIVNGEAFALTRHLSRMKRSAHVLALPMPEEEQIRGAVAETLAAEEIAWGRLRITVTGGDGPLGSERGPAGPTLIVAATSAKPWADSIAVHQVPWSRNENSAVAGAKTTSYAENVVALHAAHEAGASEALLLNTRAEVCEGTGSNVLLVLDGQLVTPPLDSGCLAGITRELLLEWAAQEGLAIQERAVMAAELAHVQGMALLSSTRDVQPVQRFNDTSLEVPELLVRAREIFARRSVEQLDP